MKGVLASGTGLTLHLNSPDGAEGYTALARGAGCVAFSWPAGDSKSNQMC